MKPRFVGASTSSLALLASPFLATSALAAVPAVENMGNTSPGVVELISRADVGLQIRASDNPTSFNASNLPNGLDIDRDTGYIDGEAQDPGTWNVTISATNADGTGTRNITFIVEEREPNLPPVQGLPTGAEDLERGMDVTGDFAPLTQWARSTNGGSTPITFYYRATGAGEGSDLIRNGTRKAYSELGMRTYVMGPAVVTFSWWCNLETGFGGTQYDFLSFYVNEDPAPSGFTAGHHPTDYIGGVTPLTDFVKVLGPGLHRLDWVLSKDYDDAASGGESNACYIDNLRITGYPEWADDKNLAPFEAGLDLDKERDGNDLLTEYALDLNPNQDELVAPLITFEPDGRAIVEIDRNNDAYGVEVDIEKSTLLSPGSWGLPMDVLEDSASRLRKRDISAGADGFYRVNVSVSTP